MIVNSKKILSILLVFLPILLYYDFPFVGVNAGTFVCFLCLIIVLIKMFKTRHLLSIFRSNIPLVLLLIYVFVSSFLSLLFMKPFSVVSFLFVVSNMIVVLFVWSDKGFLDKKLFLKTYKIVATIAVLFYVLQIIFGFSAHVLIPAKIPFLELTKSYSGINSQFISVSSSNVLNKSYSFFSEQSHFAVFLLPLFHLLIIEYKSDRLIKLLLASFVGFVIVLTNSANGIIGLLIVLFVDLLFVKNSSKFLSSTTLLKFVVFAIFVLFAYTVLIRIPYFSSMFSRLFFDSGNRMSKAGYRVYRGFYLVNTLPASKLMFGLGYLQIESYISFQGINTPFDLYNATETTLEYVNFICQIILYFGIAGFVLLSLSILFFAKHLKINQLSFLMCFIALWFSSSMLFDEMFVFFSAFIVSASALKIRSKSSSIFNSCSLAHSTTKISR